MPGSKMDPQFHRFLPRDPRLSFQASHDEVISATKAFMLIKGPRRTTYKLYSFQDRYSGCFADNLYFG